MIGGSGRAFATSRCRRWSLDWTGLGWAGLDWTTYLSPGSTAWKDVCVSRLCTLAGNMLRTNERTHARPCAAPRPRSSSDDSFVEPLARSGGGVDMCGLSTVEGSTTILSLVFPLRKDGISSGAHAFCLRLLPQAAIHTLHSLSPSPLHPRLFIQSSSCTAG